MQKESVNQMPDSKAKKVKSRTSRKSDRPVGFPYAIRSFMGYLEGTGKSTHTLKNYALDLRNFQKWAEMSFSKGGYRLETLTAKDLEYYHSHLKTQGLKTNTRRRILMTVRKFFHYLLQRKKVDVDVGRRILTPAKLERIPQTFPLGELTQTIRALPAETIIDRRNRLLLWTLAETGCQVSELTRLRFEQWFSAGEQGILEIEGKSARKVPVTADLYREALGVRSASGAQSRWLFLGFNKFGSLGAPISSRGVELLVKSYSSRLGVDGITPRGFRHSAALYWHEQGLSRKEIQERLGLKTDYAFRAYDLIFAKTDSKSKTETTSTNGSTEKGS
jgi:site-specific recombinase XerD